MADLVIGYDGSDASDAALDYVEREVVLVPNTPAEALVGLAEERDARFIVIGSHGEGRIIGALLGALPHKLPGRSLVPVVVARVPLE
jgi:nucleotide-binding universal stress UspA family protein